VVVWRYTFLTTGTTFLLFFCCCYLCLCSMFDILLCKIGGFMYLGEKQSQHVSLVFDGGDFF